MTYTPQSPNTYQGNQVIINSDRLLFNAKTDSILLFSDKAIGFSTNGSFNFDTGDNINKNKFIVNSPNIYLGLNSNKELPTEPAVLGNQLGNLLSDILGLIDDILDDIENKVGYTVTSPGSVTAPNPLNKFWLGLRRNEISSIKSDLVNIKSNKTKLI